MNPQIAKALERFDKKYPFLCDFIGKKIRSDCRDDVRDFLQQELEELEKRVREEIVEEIQPAVNDFMAAANTLAEHNMLNSAREMRENIQFIVCVIRNTKKDREYINSLEEETIND